MSIMAAPAVPAAASVRFVSLLVTADSSVCWPVLHTKLHVPFHQVSSAVPVSSADSAATYPDPPSVILRLNPALGQQGCIQNPQEVSVVVE